MKKLITILCILSCTFYISTSEVKAIESNNSMKIQLLEKFFTNDIILLDKDGNDCKTNFMNKYINNFQNKDYTPIIDDLNNNKYSFITMLPNINTYVADTAKNGYIWELNNYGQIHRVYTYATVSYNGNTGAYVSRTSARATFLQQGNGAVACGVDQSKSSATVTTNGSVDYVTYRPATYIKYDDNKYTYMTKIGFKVMCHAGAQPIPFEI